MTTPEPSCLTCLHTQNRDSPAVFQDGVQINWGDDALLHAEIDTASIALWLGHATIQTTQVYLHADLELKRRTLERLPAVDGRPPARYQASDALIAFLKNR